jgi:hypothetical protein
MKLVLVNNEDRTRGWGLCKAAMRMLTTSDHAYNFSTSKYSADWPKRQQLLAIHPTHPSSKIFFSPLLGKPSDVIVVGPDVGEVPNILPPLSPLSTMLG